MVIYIYDDSWNPQMNTRMAYNALAVMEIGKKNEIIKNRSGMKGPIKDAQSVEMLLDLLVENNIITDEVKARYLLSK